MYSSTLDRTKATGNFDIEDIIQRMYFDGIKAAVIYLLTIIFLQIIEYTVQKFLEDHKDEYVEVTKLHRYIRNGYYQERVIPLFLGIALPFSLPRIKDQCPDKEGRAEIIYPFCKKNVRSCEEVDDFSLYLYLKGISLTSIESLITKVFNMRIKGYSRSSISRKKDIWKVDYDLFLSKDLSKYSNHTLIIDATYIKTKKAKDKICLLSVVALTEEGYTVIGWHACKSESEEEWKNLFRHLTEDQGMGQPQMVITDGGKGGLSAIDECFSEALVQRCWVHKTRNILNLAPRKEYKTIVSRLRDIYQSKTREEAEQQFDIFISLYKSNNKIIECLKKDKEQLLSFYKLNDINRFKLYTTNVIEALFSVAKGYTRRARGKYTLRTVGFTTFTFISHLTIPGRFGVSAPKAVDPVPEQLNEPMSPSVENDPESLPSDLESPTNKVCRGELAPPEGKRESADFLSIQSDTIIVSVHNRHFHKYNNNKVQGTNTCIAICTLYSSYEASCQTLHSQPGQLSARMRRFEKVNDDPRVSSVHAESPP